FLFSPRSLLERPMARSLFVDMGRAYTHCTVMRRKKPLNGAVFCWFITSLRLRLLELFPFQEIQLPLLQTDTIGIQISLDFVLVFQRGNFIFLLDQKTVK